MRDELKLPCRASIEAEHINEWAGKLSPLLRPLLKKKLVFHPVLLESSSSWALAVSLMNFRSERLYKTEKQCDKWFQLIVPERELMCFLDPNTHTNWDLHGKEVQETDAYSRTEFLLIR